MTPAIATLRRAPTRAFFALCVLLVALPARPADVPADLIPLDEDYSAYESLAPYPRALRERLLLRDRPAGAYVLVMPSFEKEWALQVAVSAGRPVVTLACGEDSLWYGTAMRAEAHGHVGVTYQQRLREVLPTVGVRVTVRRAPLSDGTDRLVREAWAAALRDAAGPENRRIIDGVSWLFSARDPSGARYTALARSPRPQTPGGELAALVLGLRAHVEAQPADREGTEAAVVRLARDVGR
jgi:hypothetical protein